MNCISVFGDKISYDPGWPQLSCVAEDDRRLLILHLELGLQWLVIGKFQHPCYTVLRKGPQALCTFGKRSAS